MKKIITLDIVVGMLLALIMNAVSGRVDASSSLIILRDIAALGAFISSIEYACDVYFNMYILKRLKYKIYNVGKEGIECRHST